MVLQALIDLVVALVVGVLSIIPSSPPPEWVDNALAQVSALFGYVSGMGVWIPVTLAVQVVTAILACIVLGFTIKVIRLVVSYFTAGGGSAA